MLSKVKKVFASKSRIFSTNSKSNENIKTSSVVSVTSSMPDFTQEFSTLTQECGYVPTVLVNAAKIIEAHIEDEFLFQTQGSAGKVDYLIQILGRDRLSVPRNINIHDVVESVKVYLNRKASPVVPAEIMTQLIENHNTGDTEEDVRIISQYRKLLPDVVPSVHFVLMLMNKVAKHAYSNGMDERKLATIFVLDIMKPLSVSESQEDYEKNRLQRVQKLPYNIMVIEHLIRNVHLFEFAPYQQIQEPFSAMEDTGWASDGREVDAFTLGGWKDTSPLHPVETSNTAHDSQLKLTNNQENFPYGSVASSQTPVMKEGSSFRTGRSPGRSPVHLDKENPIYHEKTMNLKKVVYPFSKTSPVENWKKIKIQKLDKNDCQGPRQTSGERAKSFNKCTLRLAHNDRPALKYLPALYHGALRQRSATNVPPQNTVRKAGTTSTFIKKSTEPRANQSARERAAAYVQRGKALTSPPKFKPTQDKSKKATGSYYNGYKTQVPPIPSSPRKHSSDRITVEAPLRPNLARNLTPKCSKKGKTKDQKSKMFKKDEELQPWEGGITESEDISLIVRTTRNPRTFHFLEKYFTNLLPEGKPDDQEVVYDASATYIPDTPWPKKQNRRIKVKPRPVAHTASANLTKTPQTTETSKSLHTWSPGKGKKSIEKPPGIFFSSPELHNPRPMTQDDDRKQISRDDNTNKVETMKQNTRSSRPYEGSVTSRTQMVSKNKDLNVKFKNNVQWACERKPLVGKIPQKQRPKGAQSFWRKTVDLLIDTSLLGVAVVCVAYIYTVI